MLAGFLDVEGGAFAVHAGWALEDMWEQSECISPCVLFIVIILKKTLTTLSYMTVTSDALLFIRS